MKSILTAILISLLFALGIQAQTITTFPKYGECSNCHLIIQELLNKQPAFVTLDVVLNKDWQYTTDEEVQQLLHLTHLTERVRINRKPTSPKSQISPKAIKVVGRSSVLGYAHANRLGHGLVFSSVTDSSFFATDTAIHKVIERNYHRFGYLELLRYLPDSVTPKVTAKDIQLVRRYKGTLSKLLSIQEVGNRLVLEFEVVVYYRNARNQNLVAPFQILVTTDSTLTNVVGQSEAEMGDFSPQRVIVTNSKSASLSMLYYNGQDSIMVRTCDPTSLVLDRPTKAKLKMGDGLPDLYYPFIITGATGQLGCQVIGIDKDDVQSLSTLNLDWVTKSISGPKPKYIKVHYLKRSGYTDNYLHLVLEVQNKLSVLVLDLQTKKVINT